MLKEKVKKNKRDWNRNKNPYRSGHECHCKSQYNVQLLIQKILKVTIINMAT